MNCTGTYTLMDQFPDPTIKLSILQSGCKSYNQAADPKKDRKQSSTGYERIIEKIEKNE